MGKINSASIEWDIGTAYDFFASLLVMHDPERYGLRGAWAAGVRSRLSIVERECLQRNIHLLRPMRGVYALPIPKDAATMLAVMRGMTAEERLRALMPAVPPAMHDVLSEVAARRSWHESDVARLVGPMMDLDWRGRAPSAVRKDAVDLLDVWAAPEDTADGLLAALDAYYAAFFAEEEARILPVLESALERAQTLAAVLPRAALLEELSQGLRLTGEWSQAALVLVPSFWITPLVIITHFDDTRSLFVFGARPADVSLVPGEFVPDALHQALKALSEPTRLRILRYLSDEPLSPAELARRLRLRAPTVIHHLDALRLARLVIVTLEPEGKRYAVRPGSVTAAFELLNEFLAGREG